VVFLHALRTQEHVWSRKMRVAHGEKFFSLRTVTNLQGLDQACLISAKNL